MKDRVSVKFKSSYKKEGGKTIFVYRVTGSPENIARYKELQGGNLVEETPGKPLYFTQFALGAEGQLILGETRIIPDRSHLDMAQSLAAQYGGNLGETIAQQMLKGLITPSSGDAQRVENERVADPEGLDEM
jgi:hypothetical protein